jgi:hypothetical protein
MRPPTLWTSMTSWRSQARRAARFPREALGVDPCVERPSGVELQRRPARAGCQRDPVKLNLGARQKALRVALQDRKRRRHRLEEMELQVSTPLRQRGREEADVRSHVEHRGAVEHVDAVPQVRVAVEDLLVEERRLTPIGRLHG